MAVGMSTEHAIRATHLAASLNGCMEAREPIPTSGPKNSRGKHQPGIDPHQILALVRELFDRSRKTTPFKRVD